MHIQIKLPLIEIWAGKSRSRKRWHSYFVYQCSPTHWRENWRNISGFNLVGFGKYLTVAVWKQEGVYVKPRHERHSA